MKNILAKSLFSIMLCAASAVGAQNCESLVLPHFGNNRAAFNNCPSDKVAYYCRYSSTALFATDTLPEGANVYDISELQNRFTGEYLAQNVEVDLNVFSYYAYNFVVFQNRHFNHRVYFRTPGSKFRYLCCRSHVETSILCNDDVDNREAEPYTR